MQLIQKLKEFLKTAENPLIVILGATASGKTELSLNIAHSIGGEIISTDSRQIYKEMAISTDALLEKDQDGVAHHMIQICNPDKILSMAEYKEMALKKIEEIYERKHIPMLVGGTGLYVSAIIEGYAVPKIPPNYELRDKLEKEAKKRGNEFLHNKLKELDPKAAQKIHPNNLRYVIRAIEINMTSGKNKEDTKQNDSPFNVFKIGINRPREEIYHRINSRVDLQRNTGLIEEVKALLDKKYDENLPSMTSLGVKEIIPYIKGEMSLDQCLEILKKNTRHYAKRQISWLKRYKNVHWITADEAKEIVNMLK